MAVDNAYRGMKRDIVVVCFAFCWEKKVARSLFECKVLFVISKLVLNSKRVGIVTYNNLERSID